MQKESILYGIIGLLVGIVLIGFTATYAVNNQNNGMMRMMGMNTNQKSQDNMKNTEMSMSEMAVTLKDKTGDEYDKAFIEMMIKHHQGATEMAKLSATRAKNQEIKTLSQNIISAQEKEISQMQQWQMDWGYVTNGSTMPGMNH